MTKPLKTENTIIEKPLINHEYSKPTETTIFSLRKQLNQIWARKSILDQKIPNLPNSTPIYIVKKGMIFNLMNRLISKAILFVTNKLFYQIFGFYIPGSKTTVQNHLLVT